MDDTVGVRVGLARSGMVSQQATNCAEAESEARRGEDPLFRIIVAQLSSS